MVRSGKESAEKAAGPWVLGEEHGEPKFTNGIGFAEVL